MNEITIRRTFELLKQENELIEVRLIGARTNLSGYFKSVDNVIKSLSKISNCNVYFVLNRISDACYAREQSEKLIEKAKNTTTDKDITNRDWFLIDVDPKRASGVSSSDSEKEKAKFTINKVYSFLRDRGFSQPIICDSGNGYHLLYKINFENTKANADLIKQCLAVLDMYFSDEYCDIDKTVFNASRITKLYGTKAVKGNDTSDRPHRESGFIRVPEQIKETNIILFEHLAELMPKPEAPTYTNNYGRDKFDLEGFISKHGLAVTSKQSISGGTKFILDHCVFDENHKGKDAVIFQMDNGAISYKCFHNSCSDKKWQDVRLMFEPDAYSKQYQNLSNRITEKKEIKPQEHIEAKGNKFYDISEVSAIDRSQIISMPSKFDSLDKRIIGFNKGETTIWSGKNGAAKSTILNQIALNAIEAGYNGVIFSGELQPHKLKNWIYLQAAGRQYTRESNKYEGVYFVPKNIIEKIDIWLKGKLFIYNNDYGNNYQQLVEDFKEIVTSKKLDWVMFDNLMTIDLEDEGGNTNKKQKAFVSEVSAFSKQKNIHSHIVAHPRKEVGFLRKESISGTSDISNIVDNVIIAHRNNSDFQRAINDYFPKEKIITMQDCSNYLEVCKNRDLGVMDYFVGLHYEFESKRLLNEPFENKNYGWQEIGIQSTIPLTKPNKLNFEDIELTYMQKKEDDPF